MVQRAASVLRDLDRMKSEYGAESADRKLALLRILERRRLVRAADVVRLHETLCFLRAYPDTPEVLAQVERMLAVFPDRSDLRRHRRRLLNTGIAGTEVHFRFFAPTAIRLARICGAHLTIDWDAFEQQDRLEHLLPLLALHGESPGLDEFALGVRGWIDRLRGSGETDAAFLLRRLEQLHMSPKLRESLLDEFDIPLRLAPGAGAPTRTSEKCAGAVVAYQLGPLSRGRPAMPKAVLDPPVSVRVPGPRACRRLVDLARSTMAVRSRDLDAFAYGNHNDVRLVDCGGGLCFALIGMLPERRLLLETQYGFLMLKNGVPVGYGTSTALFGSAEIAFTVFDTFRAGEAALMFVRALAITRHLLGADTFVIDPYQLGQDNQDALRSGAWWFYQKLGFEPREPSARRIMRQELKRAKAKSTHRSSTRTLERLATASVFLHLEKRRDDVLGILPLAGVGLRVTDYLADRFGFDRDKAARTCAREAAELLGLRSLAGFTPGERMAWRWWGPLVLLLPGVKSWPAKDKRCLIEIVRAKGGRRESDYLHRFDRHVRLRRSLSALAQVD